MTDQFNESTVEEAALSWFEELGYAVAHGPDIAPGEPEAERESFGDVVLVGRLRDAIDRLNPDDSRTRPARKPSARCCGPTRRRWWPTTGRFTRCCGMGSRSSIAATDGTIARRPGAAGGLRRPRQQRLAGRQPVHRDRRPAQPPARHGGVRQRAAAGGDRTQERRPTKTRRSGRLQPVADLQAADPLALRTTTKLLVVSDGLQARIGSLTANQEWFKPWRTIEGEADGPAVDPGTGSPDPRRLRQASGS